ncbi:chorion class B protein ERB4 precursor [Bombyx mori]|uniref:Chorion early B n=1 Tax=Bombyx mori TaxID=7091 RepID=A0A0K2S3P5_BOMMO|nr:chorion class B protein ERB4 precursor [Bombyx mori]BAS21470.1 chorion early B [Bombyx mori]
MSSNFIVLCVSALFIQCAVSQCVGRIGSLRGGPLDGWGYDGLGYDGFGIGGWSGRGCGGLGDDIAAAAALGASHGGTLAVVSTSAAPTGLGIASENVYEGSVGVCGNLPFLGTADVAGEFPTAGLGGIDYTCGDGAVGITVENAVNGISNVGYGLAPGIVGPAVAAPALGYGPGISSLGYNTAGRGCGCGANYY